MIHHCPRLLVVSSVLILAPTLATAQSGSSDLPVSPLGPNQVLGNTVTLTEEKQRQLDELAQSVRDRPDDSLALARYGLALIRVGRKEDGLAALTRAKIKEPDEPQVKLIYAKGLWKAGYPGEAIEQALEVVESPLATRQDVADAYFVAGTARSVQGDYETGQRYLEKCVENDPRNTGAMINLGLMLASQLKASEAIRWLEKARLAEPDNVRAHLTYAQVLDQMGMVERARSAWERVAELRPENTQVMASLAHAYMNVQDFERAAPWLAKVVEAEPEQKIARLFYAEALLRLGRYDEAREQARRGAELGAEAAGILAAIEFEERQAQAAAEASTDR